MSVQLPWLVIPVAGPIRISTLAVAALVVAWLAVVRRRPLVAAAALFAWLSAFELIYYGVGAVTLGWRDSDLFWTAAALSGWILLAAALHVWPDWRLAIAFIVSMAVWIVLGFHSNAPGQRTSFNMAAEVLNEGAKTLLGAAYLVGALRLAPRRGAEPVASRPGT